MGVGLRGARVLEEVYLQGNKLKYEGIKVISEVIECSQTMRLIDLSQNQIEDQGGLTLAAALEKSKAVQQIFLRENNFHDQVGLALSEACRKNKRVLVLRLERNPIGFRYLEQIAQHLSQHRLAQKDQQMPNIETTMRQIKQIEV